MTTSESKCHSKNSNTFLNFEGGLPLTSFDKTPKAVTYLTSGTFKVKLNGAVTCSTLIQVYYIKEPDLKVKWK